MPNHFNLYGKWSNTTFKMQEEGYLLRGLDLEGQSNFFPTASKHFSWREACLSGELQEKKNED